MAMPPHGAELAGQQPQPPAPAGAQNPGPATAAAPDATYEAKIEIAHKHAADAALRDAKRACQPGVNVPFADLDDAIARLLPYHVFSAADEDELDLSVVPPIREDDDGDDEARNENANANAKENARGEKKKAAVDAPAPARSRAQAWAESRAEFVRAFVRELAAKRRRVEARDGGAGRAPAPASGRAESAREPGADDPGPAFRGAYGDALSPADAYLIAAKTLEMAKRRDAAERAARARAGGAEAPGGGGAAETAGARQSGGRGAPPRRAGGGAAPRGGRRGPDTRGHGGCGGCGERRDLAADRGGNRGAYAVGKKRGRCAGGCAAIRGGRSCHRGARARRGPARAGGCLNGRRRGWGRKGLAVGRIRASAERRGAAVHLVACRSDAVES